MTKKRLNLKEWADEDKPREKMLKKGIAALSDGELLAILFRTGTKEETAVELARRVLNSVHNNLDELSKISFRDLCKNFKGIGTTKATTLAAALELGRRHRQASALEKKQILCSRDAYNFFSPIIEDLSHEEFWVIFLNHSNKITDSLRISSGGTAATTVDVKFIFKEAINRLSSGIIIAHNHPSGSIAPSKEDKDLTAKISSGGKLLDVKLLDHIIVGSKTYYSFLDQGEL
ncbi:MAG TPA: DNA repair protein RadC [Paludibacteraceae bacterium]|mgnify:FL=1|nr:DNA repair protein RadC [Paludibacteraceae bacterium]HOO24126.1 DNA repair protein RadC [Paludibacteraceae bacterium]HOS36988.1 DNA repair protein RadC [Paludibacteraceae bacterium]HPK20636.1 DNA repair protein RadC [Paludibacteraceae bacterium]HRR59229.1 DNA repair protein RadC [Paludibacteraceae bacterium]